MSQLPGARDGAADQVWRMVSPLEVPDLGVAAGPSAARRCGQSDSVLAGRTPRSLFRVVGTLLPR